MCVFDVNESYTNSKFSKNYLTGMPIFRDAEQTIMTTQHMIEV